MGMMKVEIPHGHGPEEARSRVAALFEYWRANYGVQCTWEGDKATVKGKVLGITLDGDFTVRPGAIVGQATDPGFLLRSQAQKYVLGKFGEYLDPTRSLSDVESMSRKA